MDRYSGPCRSVLYIPGSRPRALEKAQDLPVDAIIFDLEDAVSPDEKVAARALLAQTLATADYGPRLRIVRINGFETEWGTDDLNAVAAAAPDAILLPKVNDASDIKALSDMMDAIPEARKTKIWAMMETPRGILNALDIAAAPRMEGFVLGTNDLAKDLGSTGRPAMMTSLQLCLLAARAEGLICVDGVYNAFKDEVGLEDECSEGRAMGFDGKTLIHPAQIAVTNRVFAPSEEDITLSRRQIAAFEEAEAAGQGVAVVDGKIVENLHVETAKRLIAKAEAIAALEG